MATLSRLRKAEDRIRIRMKMVTTTTTVLTCRKVSFGSLRRNWTKFFYFKKRLKKFYDAIKNLKKLFY